MVMIALPPLASELLAALTAAITTLVMVRRKPVTFGRRDDVEDRIADLTLKVRQPLRYHVTRWMR